MRNDGLKPVPDDLDLGVTIKGFIGGQRLFDRYLLKQMVGRGGMGVVWLAHDEKLEQEIALKFLPEVVRLDASALDELKRETRRSLSLTHPHIVRIHDFVDNAIAAAISMEYVNGATLSKLRIQQPTRIFEPEQIAEWLRQLCEALHYAHHKVKIVHRDLKPANLMINMEGDLKVTDFGIARSISDSVSRVTVHRGSSGTIGYMSPQQATGDAPAVTDDIYSLGATVYELLTSKPPFHSGDIPGQIRDKVPQPMLQRRGGLMVGGNPLPAAWEETVAACLAKNPKERPQDVSEIAERLGLGSVTAFSATSHHPPEPPPRIATPPPPPPPVTVTSTTESPKKSPAMLITIIVLLLIGGACFAWYFGVEQPTEQAKLLKIEVEQREALQKEEALERQAVVDAQDKVRLESQSKQDTEEALQLKSDTEKAQAAQKAADDAAAKARADAAAVQALADQKATDDAAAKARADAAAAQAAADQRAADEASRVSLAQRIELDETKLNETYASLRATLTSDQKDTLKRDEIVWIAQKDAIPLTDPAHAECLEQRIQYLQNYSSSTNSGDTTNTTLAQRIDNDETKLNQVYASLRSTLTQSQKDTLKRDEIVWIAQKDAIPVTDPAHAECLEQRIQYLQNYTP